MSTSRSGDETSPREVGHVVIDYYPAASAELVDAAQFYEGKRAGLGHAFLDSVDKALAMLEEAPLLGPSNEQGARRWLVHRFPYVILYRIESARLHVLAIAHTSRKPGYWNDRLKNALP